jgi:hypothetical protein
LRRKKVTAPALSCFPTITWLIFSIAELQPARNLHRNTRSAWDRAANGAMNVALPEILEEVVS